MIYPTDTITVEVLRSDLRRRHLLYSRWSDAARRAGEYAEQNKFAVLAHEMSRIIEALPEYVKDSKEVVK